MNVFYKKQLKDIVIYIICKTKIFRMVSFTGCSKYGMRINHPMIPYTFFVLYFWLGLKISKIFLGVNRSGNTIFSKRSSKTTAVSGVPLRDHDGKLLIHLFSYENKSTQPKFTRHETGKL
jgi:hypothetical protein